MRLYTRVALAAVVALFSCSMSAEASTVSIDFSSYASGTQIGSLDGVTFSLAGFGTLGTPAIISSSWTSPSLSNSTTGDYPTAQKLVVTFPGVASNISLTFNTIGWTGSPDSTCTLGSELGCVWGEAFGPGGNLLGTKSLYVAGYTNSFNTFTINQSGVHSLVFDNGGVNEGNWIVALGSLSADVTSISAVPEPSSIGMIGLGLVALGLLRRRARKPTPLI